MTRYPYRLLTSVTVAFLLIGLAGPIVGWAVADEPGKDTPKLKSDKEPALRALLRKHEAERQAVGLIRQLIRKSLDLTDEQRATIDRLFTEYEREVRMVFRKREKRTRENAAEIMAQWAEHVEARKRGDKEKLLATRAEIKRLQGDFKGLRKVQAKLDRSVLAVLSPEQTSVYRSIVSPYRKGAEPFRQAVRPIRRILKKVELKEDQKTAVRKLVDELQDKYGNDALDKDALASTRAEFRQRVLDILTDEQRQRFEREERERGSRGKPKAKRKSRDGG